MKNEIIKNELVKRAPDASSAEDVIEGEFKAEAEDWKGRASGFLCLKCKWPLLTGEDACSKCDMTFTEPTLPVSVVFGRLSPEAAERFWAGRTTPEEQARFQKLREMRR